ncbi:MAG: hypothetical protein JOZ72_14660 [Alphaproteobacteria bacterium]|nr:hypothetical protein [Alphaproteobacteria bacterium]
MAFKECGIEDVFETLQNNPKKNSCVLLLGAGCSFSAGIPDAKGIMKLIEKAYPSRYEKVKEKTYPNCMGALGVGTRRDLIRGIINACTKLNWAHIAIAQLLKAGFVDRILTVNFDPLIPKACAIVGEFPAIYDFVAQHDYSANRIAEKAVFYLHGQHTGFAILNTEEEVDRQAARVRPVIRDTAGDRTWIVAGYSGDNDPVFAELEALAGFDYPLYWVSYGKEDPAPHVQRLLERDNTYFIRDFSADRFFVELCQKLQCFPPAFVGAPFTHLQGTLESLAEYPQGKIDILVAAKEFVSAAIKEYEGVPGPRKKSSQANSPRLLATDLFAKNDLAGLKKLHEDEGGKNKEIADLLMWAYIAHANMLADQAASKGDADAAKLFVQVDKSFEDALAVGSNSVAVLTNWSSAIMGRVMRLRHGSGTDLIGLAIAKYRQALEADPNSVYALHGLGFALMQLGRADATPNGDKHFEAAIENFDKALKLKPDDPQILLNWAAALANLALNKTGDEANKLFSQANDKYAQSFALKPDAPDTLKDWGVALSRQSEGSKGKEADRLYELANQKFEEAVRLKPDFSDALKQWALLLSRHSKTLVGPPQDELLSAAEAKLREAYKIDPARLSYDLACVLALRNDKEQALKYLAECRDADMLPDLQVVKADEDFARIKDSPEFQKFLSDTAARQAAPRGGPPPA